MRVKALWVALALVVGADLAVVATRVGGDGSGEAALAVGVARTETREAVDLDPVPVAVVPLAAPSGGSTVLPVPHPAPTDPYEPTPEIRHGTIELPAIGVSDTLFEGVSLTAINRGPSHWPGSAMPGDVGNVIVAGHRTTHSRPFYDLDLLEPGDELVFTMSTGRHVYVLDRVEIVPDTAGHILEQTTAQTATLFACHPKGSARQRIVAHFTQAPATIEIPIGDQLRSLAPA